MEKKQSILLVDDDIGVVWSIGRFLTRSGFSVTTCPDGEEALRELKTRRFDIVITDVRMPRLHGIGVLDWVRAHQPDTRVVIITGYGSSSMRELALAKGAVLYLEKPFELPVLLELLKRSESDSKFWGTINDIDILEYIQLLLISGKNCVVEVRSQGCDPGYLYLKNGSIVHAECGDLRGETALFRCFGFPSGSFQSLPWREPEAMTITRPGEFLLFEAARMRDEGQQTPPSTSCKG